MNEVRGAEKFFPVAAATPEAYLGFGAEFVYEDVSIKVVRVGAEDVVWQHGRIASGMHAIGFTNYDNMQAAIDNEDTRWYRDYMAKRGA